MSSSPSTIQLCLAFSAFLLASSLAAIYAPIQDCDEVFNFWEPTHYLNHSYGLQTWELSPLYSIRSWLYISLHALPIQLFQWLSPLAQKSFHFYYLRLGLAGACAACHTRLFATVAEQFNPRIALIYLLVNVTSAGNFHASTSYLSSSFAMYSVILALSAFLNRRGGYHTSRGLLWLGLGTILGWPFVALLCLPFVLEDAVFSLSASTGFQGLVSRLLGGLLPLLGVLVRQRPMQAQDFQIRSHSL